METLRGNTLEHWKKNAEENYINTPISVLKYITVLEELNEANKNFGNVPVSGQVCDHPPTARTYWQGKIFCVRCKTIIK